MEENRTKKDLKNFIGKSAGLCSVVALLGIGVSTNASAKVRVELTKSMPWVNSDKVTCRQISADGKVSSNSLKTVAWVMEYRGSDGLWHYQKNSNEWLRFSPGTTVPSLTGDIYGKCDQRLQLNPYGAGDDGKGGIATGYLYVVQ